MKTLRFPCLLGLLLLLVVSLTVKSRAQVGPAALADAIDQNSMTVTASDWARVTGATAHDGVDAAQVTITSGSRSMELTITELLPVDGKTGPLQISHDNTAQVMATGKDQDGRPLQLSISFGQVLEQHLSY